MDEPGHDGEGSVASGVQPHRGAPEEKERPFFRTFSDALGDSVIDEPAILTGDNLVVLDFDVKKDRPGRNDVKWIGFVKLVFFVTVYDLDVPS